MGDIANGGYQMRYNIINIKTNHVVYSTNDYKFASTICNQANKEFAPRQYAIIPLEVIK